MYAVLVTLALSLDTNLQSNQARRHRWWPDFVQSS
jgi:hypothetical protein